MYFDIRAFAKARGASATPGSNQLTPCTDKKHPAIHVCTWAWMAEVGRLEQEINEIIIERMERVYFIHGNVARWRGKVLDTDRVRCFLFKIS